MIETGLHTIIHEACHTFQDKINAEFSKQDCYVTQLNFLKNVSVPEEEIKEIKRIAKVFPQYGVDGNAIFLEWKNQD